MFICLYVYMFICLKEGRYQYNDHGDASVVKGYDRRRPELSV